MTVPSLTALPAAPQRTDAPATFVTKADAFLGAVVTFQGEMNNSVTAFNADFVTVEDYVSDAQTAVSDAGTKATEAASSAAEAASSASAAEVTAGAGLWVSGQSYDSPDAVVSPVDDQTYRANTATSGTTDPSASSDWSQISGNYNVPTAGTKTSSYTLTRGDVGKYIDVGTGGSITVPDATFLAGDIVSIFNNTTGDVTITCSITTAYIAGADTDVSSATLGTRGIVTILFISGTECVLAGSI